MFISNKKLREQAPYIKFKNDCSFQITNNCSTLISGINGIGKSTLLLYIYKTYGNQYKMFYLTQNLINFHGVTIENIVSIVEAAYGYNKSPYDIMEFLGVSKRKTAKFNRFSGGEKQKVMIAIAFSCNADLLLLDEPLNNLDECSVMLFNQLVAEYKAPILVVSHLNLPTDKEVILDV